MKNPFNIKNIIIAKAVAWDLCSSTFSMLFKIGTKRVPPPEPKSPFTKPVKAPIIEFLTVTSSVIYVSRGTYDIKLTIQAAIGSIIGGIIGAKLLRKVTGKFLRISFGIVMIISAIRMIFY